MSSEFERIAALRAVLEAHGAPPGSGVAVGIGDDAAVLAPGAGALVWTVDAQVEGTHFRLDWMSWEDVGFRSVMAATSDLAAMAAEPVAALASLVLAPSVSDEALAALARGQAAASKAAGVPVVGGNLARGGETSLTTTVLGRAPTPILRTGARASDAVWVAGPLGASAAGLRLLARGADTRDAAAAACVAAFRRPVARLAAGLALRGRAHAAIDVSDGLAADAGHVAEASGVRVVLDEGALRAACPAEVVTVAAALAIDPLDLVLSGGEDYAVLAFAPPDVDLATHGFTRIGTCEGGPADVVLATANGLRPVTTGGFDHFAGR